jgi:hypothetical protein
MGGVEVGEGGRKGSQKYAQDGRNIILIHSLVHIDIHQRLPNQRPILRVITIRHQFLRVDVAVFRVLGVDCDDDCRREVEL